MLKLVGYHYSPYVRKVLVSLEHKGLDYQHDPLIPFIERERLLPLNPKGVVPVMVVDEQPMPESAVICRWLDDKFPESPIYPQDPELNKLAKALEDWSDATFVSVFGGGMFYQRIIKPFFLNRESSEARVHQSMTEKAPVLFCELEEKLGNRDFLAETFSVADIAITAWLRLGMLVGLTISESDHPNLIAYLQRIFAIPACAKATQMENELDVVKQAKEKYMTDPAMIELVE